MFPTLFYAQDQNYVKSVTYKQPSTISIPTPEPATAAVSLTFFDGLGRPIQQVAHKQSTTGKNIVIPIIYDVLGRQTKEYLPFPSQNNSMLFTENASVLTGLQSYYSAEYGVNDGSYPYAEKRFEASPLNRVLEQGAPGLDWQLIPNSTAGHTIKMGYTLNTTGEVRDFKATASSSTSINEYFPVALNDLGVYPEKMLYKNVVTDENGVVSHEFNNQEGQLVLKRNFSDYINLEGGTDAVNVAHDTYYVYDQYGNLSFVIPPLVNGNVTNALQELCYQYRYDYRNRLVEKKIPGKENWDYIVYDKLDRVVASGPVLAPFENLINNDKKGWMITKYDAFNRVVLTGWKDISTRASLQELYNGAVVFNEVKTTTTTSVNLVGFRYSNNVEPKLGYHVLTVNYYDDYNFAGAPVVADYNVQMDGQNLVFYTNTIKPKGLPTGSWVRVLENSTNTKAEISFTLYDKKSRPVRQYVKNYLGGFTSIDSKLDFTGKPLSVITKHKKEALSAELQLRENFSYSDQDLLLKHTHQIVGLSTPELLAKNEYNEIGQLIRKSVGGIDITGVSSLQKVDYKYNIRGWLKNINDIDELTNLTDPTDLFAFKMSYNEVTNNLNGIIKPLFNGNISETFWKSESDNIIRNYGYQYDALNRLTNSIYQKNNIETNSYNERVCYDKNGNIKKMYRTGYQDDSALGVPFEIDNLIYTYKDDSYSNQLMAVTDLSTKVDGFNDVNVGGNDFKYDSFGNMDMDLNKGIERIYYNYLNLPTKIDFGSKGKISYLYTALGAKLGKTVTTNSVEQGTVINTTEYLGGFQYKYNELQFFPTAEGYVRVTDGTKFDYVYNYTDHLGNVRLSYCDLDKNGVLGNEKIKICGVPDPETGLVDCISYFTSSILEESHYYPFGLQHSGYVYGNVQPNYQYKYNGKEYQDELNLNHYDYGARNYDPAIGRWMNVDPLAETSRRFSPYTYALNNPVFFIDPDGMEAKSSSQNTMTTDDVDVMVDIGYGRMREASQISGAVGYSGAMAVLNKKGQEKVKGIVERELTSRFKKDANNKYIIDPDGKPDLTLKGVLHLNKNVDFLEQTYNDGGKPNVRFDIKSNKYVGLAEFGDVNLNPSKITSNLKFAAVLFHEYRHAWQYASGNYYHWAKEFGYGFVENYQERDAYWFQNQMGAGSFFDGYSRYVHYSSLTKNITYK